MASAVFKYLQEQASREVTRRCNDCGEIIFRGFEVKYPLQHGDYEKETEGDYFEGCGRCDECGRELCCSCGDVQDSVCESCREELESEELVLVEDGENITGEEKQV